MKQKPPRWASMAMTAAQLRKAGCLTLGFGVVGLGGTWMVVAALMTGAVVRRGGADYTLAKEPLGFAFNVGVLALGTVICLSGFGLGVRVLLRGVYRPAPAELEAAREATPPIVRRLRRGS